MWHAIIVPPICFFDHICDTVTAFKLQTPRPVRAANWWSTSPPQGSLSFLILRYPNLEKTPNLNRFYKKRKNWVYLIKNWNDIFGNWSISTRDLLPSKIMNFKKYTLFIKLPLLLNFTQFYIPGNNSNLKNELKWKTPFFLKNKDPCPTIGHKDQTGRKRTAKWEIRITEYVLSWPSGQH